MNTLSVVVGEELFQFESFMAWVSRAKRRFTDHRVRSEDVLCVDAQGRICTKGAEFMRANSEKTFPIRVYRKLV